MNRRDFIRKTALGIAGLLLTENNHNKQFKANPKDKLTKRETLEFCIDSKYNFNEDDLKKYNSWIDSTLNSPNKYAIIVDKLEAKLFLYNQGNLQMVFPVDLGLNPYDDKQMQGDFSTPEGMYKLAAKVPNSSFYKGFLINYPNEKDILEFKEKKTEGKIPVNADIGGSIMIHGNGSGRASKKYKYNWTHGCMAMSDDDIDKIYNIVPEGTPITIVKYTDKNLR